MENIDFVKINQDDELVSDFFEMWLSYMHEMNDERSDDNILKHAKKVLEIQYTIRNRIYNTEICMVDKKVIGFCIYCNMEIEKQTDTEFGIIIKPLVNYTDYGYIMEYYIRPEYRLKNYGKMMFNHIREMLKTKNIKTIMLTPDKNARIFWEKLEFSDSGKIDPTNDQSIFLLKGN
jgi:GNAT superfamily N-acetyltransferase